MELQIGLIGAGVMGRGHAEFIRDYIPDARVVAVSDPDQSRGNSLAKDIGGETRVFESPQEMIAHENLNALIIASPDALHVEHVRLAIKANLPTLCEKPMATNMRDIEELSDEIATFEALAGRRMIHFGFMRRFDPAYLKLRTLIESQEFGAPILVRTIARNVTSPGITTEGLYTNIAVHDFDIWRWLLKDEWVSVTSHFSKTSGLSPKNLFEPLVFAAKLAGGVLVVGDVVANGNYGYDLRTEVLCEKGSLEIGIFGEVNLKTKFQAQASQGGLMVANWIPRFKNAYIAELGAWISTVRTGVEHPDLATAEDAFAATAACFLGIDSMVRHAPIHSWRT